MDDPGNQTIPLDDPPIIEPRFTIIGRAVSLDGGGIQSKWIDLNFEDAVEAEASAQRLLREAFERFFGQQPSDVVTCRFPYMSTEDTEDDDVDNG